MIGNRYIIAFFFLLWPAALNAQESGKEFIAKAIQGNLAEISMGKLAQNKATSKDVREYGDLLVKDHSAAKEDAQAVARSIGAEIPSSPTAQQRNDMEKLSKLEGSEFDRTFMQHMVKDHAKEIKLYEAQASNGTGPITEYAKKTLSALQKHRKRAQAIASNLGT